MTHSDFVNYRAAVISLAVTLVLVSAGCGNAPSEPQARIVPMAQKIVDGKVAIAARRAVTYQVDVQPGMLDPVLKGNFNVSGGSGNDIEAAISDRAGITNWVNGHDSTLLWHTPGQLTTGDFEVKLQPGTYYLALSNRFSLMSDKTVALTVNLAYKQQEPVKPK